MMMEAVSSFTRNPCHIRRESQRKRGPPWGHL